MLRFLVRLYDLVVVVGAVPAVAWGFGRSWVLGAVLLVVLGAQWSAVAVVVALRWLDPPTSAFMARASRAQRPSRVAVEYIWVPEEALSPELRLAAMAGEDAYFIRHSGFDWESLRSAREYNKTARNSTSGNSSAGRPRRGGSTISQQVAKNLFLWEERSYVRKAIEVYLTLLIESAWPKRRILEVYLNIAQFGPHTFGAEAASRRFFQKSAASLTRPEAALLVAVLPNPRERRVDQPERALRYRQLLILGSMNKLGPRFLDWLDASPRRTAR